MWVIELDDAAARDLKSIDRTQAARIYRTLQDRIAKMDDPRAVGQPLVGKWSGNWRWRIGDYRVIGYIEDQRLVITVIRIAHRREAYR